MTEKKYTLRLINEHHVMKGEFAKHSKELFFQAFLD